MYNNYNKKYNSNSIIKVINKFEKTGITQNENINNIYKTIVFNHIAESYENRVIKYLSQHVNSYLKDTLRRIYGK